MNHPRLLISYLGRFCEKWNLLKKAGSEAIQAFTQENHVYHPYPGTATPPSTAARGTSVCPACTVPSNSAPAWPTGLCTLATRHPDKPADLRKGTRSPCRHLTLSLGALQQVKLDSPKRTAAGTPRHQETEQVQVSTTVSPSLLRPLLSCQLLC